MTEHITNKHISDFTSPVEQARLKKRYAEEMRFRRYGMLALSLALLFLGYLLFDIVSKAIPAFTQYKLTLSVPLPQDKLDPQGTKNPKELYAQDYAYLLRTAIYERFPFVSDRKSKKQIAQLLSTGADTLLRKAVSENPNLIGQSPKFDLILSTNADLALKELEKKQKTFQFNQSIVRDATNLELWTSNTPIFAQFFENIKNSRGITLKALQNELGANKTKLTKLVNLEQNQTSSNKDKFNNDSLSINNKISELETELKALEEQMQNSSSHITLENFEPSLLVNLEGGILKVKTVSHNQISGQFVVPPKDTNLSQSTNWSMTVIRSPEKTRKLSDNEIAFLLSLKQNGEIKKEINWAFLTSSDSREPELAGIWGGLIGSAFMMLVTIGISLPLGVGAAIYLEEFAAKNRFTDIIETNINNLAAVPSIVFGLLGLQIFLNIFELPRSAPLVGGLVLSLLILPTIIIASRTALRSIPPSIREAALGVGATHQQAVFHHVLPLAMPGIMTGTIIGLAHALGETAPLLMIGMVAFVVDIPGTITDAATALPVQIYLWADLPEEAFRAKTAAAIMVLLMFLVFMNSIAVMLRKRFERRW